MADVIKKKFGSSKYGMKIAYSYERKPLGTGGAIMGVGRRLKEYNKNIKGFNEANSLVQTSDGGLRFRWGYWLFCRRGRHKWLGFLAC
jgi:NDP-sugar pyrophosphorylase family protein